MNLHKILFLFITCVLITITLPVSGFCELKAMNDDELSGLYAQSGFSNFTITHNDDTGYDETMAWFNIRAFTYTEIDSLKLGYHDEYNYKDPTPTTYGWDEDWVNVKIGGDINNPSEDFHAEGFYFKAAFTNIDTPASRELKSFKFGFDYVQGPISADFINYSGTIDDSNDNTPEYNGHILNLGPVTITADPGNTGNGGMEISLNIENYDKGYWVTFENAVVTP